MITIRKANKADAKKIWPIVKHINSKGEFFPFLPETPEEEMMDKWMNKDMHVYVATENNEIVGTFYMKDNQPGLGSHIANAGYAVSQHHGGTGIGKLMGEFS